MACFHGLALTPRIYALETLFSYDVGTQNHMGWETNMAKQIGVQVGQQYVKVHSTRNPPPVWEVMSIYSGVIGIAHAGLMKLDDPLHKKTVSFSTLLDKTHYRLVSDVDAAA